jgi:hypothetical protein
MDDRPSPEQVPIWRIIMYACIAAGGVAALGLYFHDRGMVAYSAMGGILVGGFALLITRAKGKVAYKQSVVRGPVNPIYKTIIQCARVLVILGLLIRLTISLLHKK